MLKKKGNVQIPSSIVILTLSPTYVLLIVQKTVTAVTDRPHGEFQFSSAKDFNSQCNVIR